MEKELLRYLQVPKILVPYFTKTAKKIIGKSTDSSKQISLLLEFLKTIIITAYQ